MSKSALIGIAIDFVASELSRRGVIARPTVKNTAAYDIVAVTRDGKRHVNIQVKASSQKVSFFPMPHVSKIRRGVRDRYVLVRWLEQDARYNDFFLTGKQAYAATRPASAYQAVSRRKGTLGKVYPCIYVSAGNEPEMKQWRRAWE